jgi:hypothetical protein
MPRAALPAVALLLLIGGAAWWLLGGAEPSVATPGEASAAAAASLPDPGRLATAAAPDAPIEDASAPARSEVEAESPSTEESAAVAWFRGRVRIVEGALAAPPPLAAAVSTEAFVTEREHLLRLDGADLAFALPAMTTNASAKISFPDFLEPVGVRGGGTLSGQDVLLERPADGIEVDVVVKPHLAVQFLHDPSGAPLADADVQSKLEEDGSSTTWGEQLDADGMLYFELAQLANMESAETLTFTVARPPDVGSSAAPPLRCDELDLLPQPLVLRFASSASLRFRIVDPARTPLAGARVLLGSQWEPGTSDVEGWFSALQSLPPAERVRVEREGFVAAEDPVTGAAAGEGQEVMMWPASWILLVGTERPAEGWDTLRVEIAFDGDTDGSLLAPHRFTTGGFTESSGTTGSEWQHDRRKIKHTTALSSQGRARLDGIHVDVPAAVTVSYRGTQVLQQRVAIQPGDGEHRIEVPKLPELLPLRGRVTDLAGRPLDGVRVRAILDQRDSLADESDAEGAFDLGGVAAGAAVTLTFHQSGFARRVVTYLAEAQDDDSVGVVTLEPGRALVVQVVGPDGAPFVAPPGSWGVGVQPRIRVPGERVSPVRDESGTLGPGEWRFTDLPHGPVTILLPGDGLWEEEEHVVSTDDARVALALTPKALAWLMEPKEE